MTNTLGLEREREREGLGREEALLHLVLEMRKLISFISALIFNILIYYWHFN